MMSLGNTLLFVSTHFMCSFIVTERYKKLIHSPSFFCLLEGNKTNGADAERRDLSDLDVVSLSVCLSLSSFSPAPVSLLLLLLHLQLNSNISTDVLSALVSIKS